MTNKYLEKLAETQKTKKKTPGPTISDRYGQGFGAIAGVGAVSRLGANHLLDSLVKKDLGAEAPHLAQDIASSFKKEKGLDVRIARSGADFFPNGPEFAKSRAVAGPMDAIGPHFAVPESFWHQTYGHGKDLPKHGYLNMAGSKNKSVLLHELGHANFRKNLGAHGSKIQSALYGVGQRVAKGPFTGFATMIAASSKDDHKSKGLSVSAAVPGLAMVGEETLASGSGFHHVYKKQGLKTAMKSLPTWGKALGTYVLPTLVPGAAGYAIGRNIRKHRLAAEAKEREKAKGIQKQASTQPLQPAQPNLTRETLKNMGTDLAFSLPASVVGAGAGVVGARALGKGTFNGAASELWDIAKKKASAMKNSKGMGRAGLVAALPLIGYEAGGHIGSYFGRRHHLQNMEAEQAGTK